MSMYESIKKTQNDCNWINDPEMSLDYHHTECGFKGLYLQHYKFCPFCGKRIKEVERRPSRPIDKFLMELSDKEVN